MPEKLFIATPVYERSLTLDYHTSLIETVAVCYREGISIYPNYVSSPLVGQARNILAARFMATDCTHMLFIDSDIGWKPESLMRLLYAMRVADDIEALAVCYPMKTLPLQFPVWLEHPPVQHPLVPVVEASHVPTGFLMLRRSAFDRFAAAYQDLRCTFEAAGLPEQWSYFNCSVEDGKFYSEDYGFSRAFRRCGGRLWVDPEPTLKHVGNHDFVGRLADCFGAATAAER